jgi:hypothetical protein
MLEHVLSNDVHPMLDVQRPCSRLAERMHGIIIGICDECSLRRYPWGHQYPSAELKCAPLNRLRTGFKHCDRGLVTAAIVCFKPSTFRSKSFSVGRPFDNETLQLSLIAHGANCSDYT